MRKYLNLMSIRHDGKGIPYGGRGELREDGDANYGFKMAKNAPEVIEQIPELAKDKALKELMLSINAPETSLFSVGCTSALVSDESGHRYTGYAEFAVNSKEAVQDAAVYFPIFFHFDSFLNHSKFDTQIKFDWELMQAHFLDANVGGFTCSVFINTFHFPSPSSAYEAWEKALDALSVFFRSVGGIGGEKIY